MSVGIDKVVKILQNLEANASLDDLLQKLHPDFSPSHVDFPRDNSIKSIGKRREIIQQKGIDWVDSTPLENSEDVQNLNGSIENFIGFTQIPTGIIGPLRVNGVFAKGDYSCAMAFISVRCCHSFSVYVILNILLLDDEIFSLLLV